MRTEHFWLSDRSSRVPYFIQIPSFRSRKQRERGPLDLVNMNQNSTDLCLAAFLKYFLFFVGRDCTTADHSFLTERAVHLNISEDKKPLSYSRLVKHVTHVSVISWYLKELKPRCQIKKLNNLRLSGCITISDSLRKFIFKVTQKGELTHHLPIVEYQKERESKSTEAKKKKKLSTFHRRRNLRFAPSQNLYAEKAGWNHVTSVLSKVEFNRITQEYLCK